RLPTLHPDKLINIVVIYRRYFTFIMFMRYSSDDLSFSLTFSSKVLKTINKTGMINIPNITPESIPPAARKLIECLHIAEGPTLHIRGTYPATNAREVMRMGRRRNLAPIMAAS